MENRPKIKIASNQLDKFLELACVILLIFTWGVTIYNYVISPITVPIHFDFSGKPDRYGDKLALLFVPIIPTVVYMALTKLNNYPHIFNYTTSITTDNAAKQYSIAIRMIRILKVAVVLIFAVDGIATLLVTMGISKGLGVWFLPLAIFLLSTPIILSIVQSKKVLK